jgi:hypothetical protein
MNYKYLSLVALSFFSLGFDNYVEVKPLLVAETTIYETTFTTKENVIDEETKVFYDLLDANSFELPKFESFTNAYKGYEALKAQGKIQNEMLTIVDFSLSSKEDRMWVINMETKEVVLQTLVAHGRNSGLEFADSFSNISESFQSSLGFYLTGESYIGKHGLSLRLDGLEEGINSAARERAVVIHGADYVSDQFIRENGRLGRSLGCPSVSNAVSKKLINLIKEKSCLFIYHATKKYVAKSNLI